MEPRASPAPGALGGEVEQDAPAGASEDHRDGDQSQSESFWFPSAGVVAGEGEQLHPRGDLGGEGEMAHQIEFWVKSNRGNARSASVRCRPDPILTAGAAPVPQLEVRQLRLPARPPSRWSRTP